MIIIKNKKLEVLIILLIIGYTCCYYIAMTGYYDYHTREKTILTNERIKEFESDVMNGENIDIKEYLVEEDKDYTNTLTNIVYMFSEKGTKVTRKIIKMLFKKMSKYVSEED
ncbi:MAG: hypothetical protein IKI04_00895 [Bacilli bacterium]|nr:hypothetical protein [Bacilli bacterium]